MLKTQKIIIYLIIIIFLNLIFKLHLILVYTCIYS